MDGAAPRNSIRDHIRQRLKLIGRRRDMFQVEVTTEQMATLQKALNRHIGEVSVRIGQLARAHGAGAPCVEDMQADLLKADRLYQKLIAAPFRMLEAAR
jgi:hypothetical protein